MIRIHKYIDLNVGMMVRIQGIVRPNGLKYLIYVQVSKSVYTIQPE